MDARSYRVLAIVGPTAVGKSAVADLLASRIESEVLSADAMQIYTGMDIGTAKMPPSECKVPLRLVDIVSPGVPYSAALYQRDCRVEIERLIESGKTPVICGGTGLYIRAALDDMRFPTGKFESDRRSKLNDLAEELGPEGLHRLLAEKDPASAAEIHPHNVRRIIRALEMFDEGTSYALQKQKFSLPQPYYETAYFGLEMDRERLYKRIDARVDAMFHQGLVSEVQKLVDQGYAHSLTSMQAIGYKEIIDVFDGLATLDEARELIKRRSRRYAKRQLSWFRRDSRIRWISMDELDVTGAVDYILGEIQVSDPNSKNLLIES